jgi:protein phosphatase
VRAPLVVEIPDPSLVVLVGAAGAGKSTFAARHFAPGEVLSSDALREAIAGDAADQRATRPAFAALHRALSRRLGAGRLTVVDATNVTPTARRALLQRAAAAGLSAVAIVLDLGPGVVDARNATRAGRRVPRDAVLQQLADLEAGIRAGALEAEGFALVVRLADPADVNAVRIARVSLPPNPPLPPT